MSVIFCLLLVVNYAAAQKTEEGSSVATLQLSLELASDFASADASSRTQILDAIKKGGDLSRKELSLANDALAYPSDSHYRSLVPAQGEQSLDYLQAMQVSYSRYKAAQAAGDREWSGKQIKAAQEYAAVAANALIAEVNANEEEARKWATSAFAVRRSPGQQSVFIEKLKTAGLSPEQRKLLRDSEVTDPEIDEFQKQLLQEAPDQIGVSFVEWLSKLAASRRVLVDKLRTFSTANPAEMIGSGAQLFVVGNPHDKEETVDLFIRPISIPPDWKLSLANAREAQSEEQKRAAQIREIQAGKHYAVTLPAKGQVKVASIVVPVGEVGTNTTVRWAVEGKIGNELIGGMVDEMNVPYIIADLQLPPVGSKEIEEELPVPSRNWTRIAAEIGAGIVILGLLAYFFLFWRRRRRTTLT